MRRRSPRPNSWRISSPNSARRTAAGASASSKGFDPADATQVHVPRPDLHEGAVLGRGLAARHPPRPDRQRAAVGHPDPRRRLRGGRGRGAKVEHLAGTRADERIHGLGRGGGREEEGAQGGEAPSTGAHDVIPIAVNEGGVDEEARREADPRGADGAQVRGTVDHPPVIARELDAARPLVANHRDALGRQQDPRVAARTGEDQGAVSWRVDPTMRAARTGEDQGVGSGHGRASSPVSSAMARSTRSRGRR